MTWQRHLARQLEFVAVLTLAFEHEVDMTALFRAFALGSEHPRLWRPNAKGQVAP